MNSWEEKKKFAIVEADDFQDKYNRNGLNFLFYWKAKYPKFKITLFTIPNRTSEEFLALIMKHSDWIELAVHGWDHEPNFECYGWDYEKCKSFMHRTYKMGAEGSRTYKKIFKAPGWTITGQEYIDSEGNRRGKWNGYPPAPEDPIAQDHQANYKALRDCNFVTVDRHYNVEARPDDSKIICIDCQKDFVHMHTWNMMTPDPNERNGFEQVEELHGVPWDKDTEFKFISEAWEEGLITPCRGK